MDSINSAMGNRHELYEHAKVATVILHCELCSLEEQLRNGDKHYTRDIFSQHMPHWVCALCAGHIVIILRIQRVILGKSYVTIPITP